MGEAKWSGAVTFVFGVALLSQEVLRSYMVSGIVLGAVAKTTDPSTRSAAGVLHCDTALSGICRVRGFIGLERRDLR